MIELFLQLSPDKLTEVTPYNSLGYGILVLSLTVAVVFLWRAWAGERAENINNLKQSSGILHQVAEYLKKSDHMENFIAVKFEELKTFINSKIKNDD